MDEVTDGEAEGMAWRNTAGIDKESKRGNKQDVGEGENQGQQYGQGLVPDGDKVTEGGEGRDKGADKERDGRSEGKGEGGRDKMPQGKA